jgi:hypothetical protein
LESADGQIFSDRNPEDRGCHQDQSRHRENPPGGGDGKASDLLQHASPSAVVPALTYQW